MPDNRSWTQIWSNWDATAIAGHESHDPVDTALRISGYDTPTASGVAAGQMRAFVDAWAQQVGIVPGERVYEAGCGAGAILETIRRAAAPAAVDGSDISVSLLESARSLLPRSHFEVVGADEIPTDPPYDHVLSFGSFIYFPSLDYAARALARMATKAVRSVSVMDVPDLALREETEAARRAHWGDEEYERRYAGLGHCYFPRSWFIETLGDDWDVSIADQSVPGYANGRYRFNVVALRR